MKTQIYYKPTPTSSFT